jgi:hypothetical protein
MTDSNYHAILHGHNQLLPPAIETILDGTRFHFPPLPHEAV